MKEYIISGFVKSGFFGLRDDWSRVALIQEDGFIIDLIERFNAIRELNNKMPMTVEYHVSDKKQTKSEMISLLMGKLYGDCDAEYSRNSYHYSSYTSGVDYDCNLTIGGHDLLQEIRNYEGKFVMIIITIKDDKDLTKQS